MTEKSEIAAAYIAGFFDGEGCVYIARTKHKERPNPSYVLFAEVSNTNHQPLEFIKNFAGYGSIYLAHPHTIDRNPCYRWMCGAYKACDFLRQIYQYLQIKKPEVELAFEFQAFKDRYVLRGRPYSAGSLARCHEYYKEMRRLKGNPHIEQYLEQIVDVEADPQGKFNFL